MLKKLFAHHKHTQLSKIQATKTYVNKNWIWCRVQHHGYQQKQCFSTLNRGWFRLLCG